MTTVLDLSHDFHECRRVYVRARNNGCPSVNIVEFGGGYFAGETSDGSVLVENVSGCCKWAMKYEVVQEWQQQKNK
jgi:hypothetical protein